MLLYSRYFLSPKGFSMLIAICKSSQSAPSSSSGMPPANFSIYPIRLPFFNSLPIILLTIDVYLSRPALLVAFANAEPAQYRIGSIKQCVEPSAKLWDICDGVNSVILVIIILARNPRERRYATIFGYALDTINFLNMLDLLYSVFVKFCGMSARVSTT